MERSQHDGALRRALWRREEGESELGVFEAGDFNKFDRHLQCSHAPDGHDVSNEILSHRPQLPITDVNKRRLRQWVGEGEKVS